MSEEIEPGPVVVVMRAGPDKAVEMLSDGTVRVLWEAPVPAPAEPPDLFE